MASGRCLSNTLNLRHRCILPQDLNLCHTWTIRPIPLSNPMVVRQQRDPVVPKPSLARKIKRQLLDQTVVPGSKKILVYKVSEKDWIDIWKNKDKIDSFGEVKGETTVYGRKFEIRTILKAKQDILNELIMRDDIISLQEVKDGFYNHKAKEKFDDDVYLHLDKLCNYHKELESYAYADGFISTKKNLKRYMNEKPLKLT